MTQQENEFTKEEAEPSQNPKAGGGKQKLTRNQKIMIAGFVGIILAIILAAIVIIRYLNRPEPEPAAGNGNLTINEDNLQEITDDIKTAVADGMFLTDMNVDWIFPDGKSASTNAIVGNSTSNHRPIFFEVILSGTQEVIYTSDVIPVGYSLREIKLEKDLDPGFYGAVCNYHLIDEETGETVSTLGIDVTLRVEK